MNILKMTAALTVFALTPVAAYAADLQRGVVAAPAPAALSGAYVSVFAGAGFDPHVTGHYTGAFSGFSVDFPLQTGYLIGAAIGTHLTSNLRGEIELSYAAHGANGATTTTRPNGSTFTEPDAGNFNTTYLLGNLWYDIDAGGGITPYLGGGIGAAVLMPNFSSGGYVYGTNLTAFAAQLGAGFKFQLADNMTVDLGYRAKGVFGGTMLAATGGVSVGSVQSIDQTVQAGLTIGF